MTYRAGDLLHTVPAKSPECDESGPCVECMGDDDAPLDSMGMPRHAVHDSRSAESPLAQAVFLPHSCDEWVIGGPAEVRALRDDLNLMLEMWGDAS